jgi:hypothetical protein
MAFGPSTFSNQSLTLTSLYLTVSSQDKERSVEKLWRKAAPLKIGTIKTKKGEVLLGEKFTDNDDWFKGLTVVIENISGKTITYIGAGFLFPRQFGDGGKAPPLYKSLDYGLHPDAPVEAAQNNQPLALKPGEKIAVTLSDVDYFEVKNNLIQLEYAFSIKTIKFNLQEVYFDDGTSWVAGTWFPRNREKTIRPNQGQKLLSHMPGNSSSLLNNSFREKKQGNLPVFF